MDKGRAKDPALNAQCRRAAGLMTGAGIRWCRRHVESGRNPTDKGSRLADSGVLQPGEIVRRTPAAFASRCYSSCYCCCTNC